MKVEVANDLLWIDVSTGRVTERSAEDDHSRQMALGDRTNAIYHIFNKQLLL